MKIYAKYGMTSMGNWINNIFWIKAIYKLFRYLEQAFCLFWFFLFVADVEYIGFVCMSAIFQEDGKKK
jgi:hypothetical protein